MAELARQTQILQQRKASLLASSQVGSSGKDLLGRNGHSSAKVAHDADRNKSLKEKVADHDARKQRKAAAKLAEKQKQSSNVTMGGIRAIPDVRREVEDYISQLRKTTPTLSSDPTAGGFAVSAFQPAGVYGGGVQATPGNNQKYIYVEELGQTIPVVTSLKDLPAAVEPRRSSQPVNVVSDSDCSEDEDCPLEPEPGTCFVWRKHSNGQKYFKPVSILDQSPEMITAYRLDKSTGNYEQILVPKELGKQKKSALGSSQNRIACKSSTAGSTKVYKDYRVVSAQGASNPVKREERQPSFVSGDSEKQGKESRVPTLVQYARDCPVSWTSKVTSSGLNPVLFSWAFIAELLASRTGQAPSLPDGELEARLQHFLSVLEVTLQTTLQSDFSSDSWKIARLYHQKVQDKVDTGVYTWLDLSQHWGTATLPHELMAANAELATKTIKKVAEKSPKGKKVDEKKLGLCYTWNSCDTRGKCKWEVQYQGQKCKLQHYCTWCKAENNQINEHQKNFCKKRQEKENE